MSTVGHNHVCEFGLTCCPCSQHICAIVRLSGLSFVSEQDERCCQISLEHNGLVCREVCYGPVPSRSLYQTLHLTVMLPAHLNGSSIRRLGDVVAVSSYFQKTVGCFQGWRIVQFALLAIKI